MSIDVVMITTDSRPELLDQSVMSLVNNAANWRQCKLTIVGDNTSARPFNEFEPDMTILHSKRQGASASRNIGASSIPRYRRQKYVIFSDDDCYYVKDWDLRYVEVAERLPRHLISAYGHPYNQEEDRGVDGVKFPLLVSSVCPMMTWEAFDEIGYWAEPGGPSASEDYEYCQRAMRLGYGFAVLNPQRVIHTGLISSRGDKIVGYDSLKSQNSRLEETYNIKGTVSYG